MKTIKENKKRENRIYEEIIVDAYGPEERALGWFYHLQDALQFPFQARCRVRKQTSPLSVGDAVEVIDMATEEVCEHDMLVEISWQGKSLAVPLSQLEAIRPTTKTKEAIDDWHYWIQRGYEL